LTEWTRELNPGRKKGKDCTKDNHTCGEGGSRETEEDASGRKNVEGVWGVMWAGSGDKKSPKRQQGKGEKL